MGYRRSIPGTRCKNARRSWIRLATRVLPTQNTHHKHPPRREVSVVARGATFSSHPDFQLRYRRSHWRFSSPSWLLWTKTMESHRSNLSLCVSSSLMLTGLTLEISGSSMVGRGRSERDVVYTHTFPRFRSREIPGLLYTGMKCYVGEPYRETGTVVVGVIASFICILSDAGFVEFVFGSACEVVQPAGFALRLYRILASRFGVRQNSEVAVSSDIFLQRYSLQPPASVTISTLQPCFDIDFLCPLLLN